ncbi:MAG: hydrogenase maturation nickel metallochaperone HypA [Clostridia bacterium]|nr:hydrogenase maturation nickel metallochaperone HypA [Clostridia bacterium]
MHELGIVMNVISQVEKVAEENKVNAVKALTMEVGEVSSVVPDLFKDCFEWAKKRTKYMTDCELDLVVLEAISYCRDCKSNYKTTTYAKECPHCKSVNTYLITGNEINIHDIKVI